MNLSKRENIRQNEQEEKTFKDNLHSLLNGNKQLASRPLVIGKTPYSLANCGANGELPLTITKKVIDKCMRPEIRDKKGKLIGPTGHGLTEKQLRDALFNIKAPVMILRGAKNNSLVIITHLSDKQNREIVITVELNKIGSVGNINNITSAYGRTNFIEYLDRQIDNKNIIALNKEKTDKMLLSIEKWYLEANTFISFDNSIAYTADGVNYPKSKNEKPFSQLLKEGYTFRFLISYLRDCLHCNFHGCCKKSFPQFLISCTSTFAKASAVKSTCPNRTPPILAQAAIDAHSISTTPYPSDFGHEPIVEILVDGDLEIVEILSFC